jgi:hypothetical protein
MKSIREILRSSGFMREVSILLFGFAAIGGLVAVLFITMGSSNHEAVASGLVMLAQVLIYIVLAIFIRRGSIKALWVAGAFFVLDTIAILAFPVGSLGGAIFWRALLIIFIIRYIIKQRRAA